MLLLGPVIVFAQGGGLAEDAVDVPPGTQKLGAGSAIGKSGLQAHDIKGDMGLVGDKHMVRVLAGRCLWQWWFQAACWLAACLPSTLPPPLSIYLEHIRPFHPEVAHQCPRHTLCTACCERQHRHKQVSQLPVNP